MKGIVLAGGTGSRLYPLTLTENKHLLPVGSKPMVYYPIEMLALAGLEEVLLITSRDYAGDFIYHLRRGKKFGLRSLEYEIQEQAGGIADALGLAKDFAEGESVCVLLADNIFEYQIKQAFDQFKAHEQGAHVLLAEVEHPQHYGVPVFEGERIVRIEEKPADPKSTYAVTGCYLYDREVFEIVSTLKPSGRGELEITDVNNAYLSRGQLRHSIVRGGWWDAGESIEQYQQVSATIHQRGANKREDER